MVYSRGSCPHVQSTATVTDIGSCMYQTNLQAVYKWLHRLHAAAAIINTPVCTYNAELYGNHSRFAAFIDDICNSEGSMCWTPAHESSHFVSLLDPCWLL